MHSNLRFQMLYIHFFVVFCLFFFGDGVSLFNPGWPRPQYLDQAVLLSCDWKRSTSLHLWSFGIKMYHYTQQMLWVFLFFILLLGSLGFKDVYMSVPTFNCVYVYIHRHKNKIIYRFIIIILNIFRIIFKWIHFVDTSFGYCLPWFALFYASKQLQVVITLASVKRLMFQPLCF